MKKGIIVCLTLLIAITSAHSHGNEPAHLKYSRGVNEAAAKEAHSHDGGHSHSDAHSHNGGHSHSDAHSHDGGHSHSDTHSHNGGHSHADAHSHEEHGHSHASTDAHVHSQSEHNHSFSSSSNIWFNAIGATLLISAAPCVILMFIPIQDNTSANGPLLKILLAFGSGGLLGDAFLHLIPHTQMELGSGCDEHSHSHSHSHGDHGHSHGPHDLSVGGWVLTGIIVFLIVEKFVRIIRGDDGHGHSHGQATDNAKKCENDQVNEKSAETGKTIKVAAYLNLVADFTHNFTDGLAIGASFVAGNTVGVVTMIAVLVHEIPHEIGDFAILIQSGYTKRKAMCVQLLTALGALTGCLISLFSANSLALAEETASVWVLPFTAGGFIYIATVSVIPELLEKSSTRQSVQEIAALLTGIGMMYLISIFE